jgi:RNA polymerase sigma factor (sigma-70 family)
MDDPKAFEQLVARYQGAVCAVAYAVLRDRARSEEVAQEAFLIAWQKLPAVQPPPPLPAWVCGIAKNLARNAARRARELPMTETTREPVANHTPVELMLDRERHQLAERALAELAESDREALVLYYRGDETFADVATALGIQETAARQRVHRARERLKSALASVEASLRATRPSHAFTAACVAALAVQGGSASAAVATSTAKRAWIAAPIAALVIGGGAAIAVTSSPDGSSSPAQPAVASTIIDARAHEVPLDSAYLKRIGATQRATALDKLRAKRVGSGGTSGPELAARPTKVYDFSGDVLAAKPNVPPPDPIALTKSTMRYAIRDVTPLLLECYGEAFDRLARKDGTLEVRLSLVGEPGQPTLVDTVELGGDAHLTADPGFAECVRETLSTVEMPAMTAAETWSVTYPLTMPGLKP